MPSQPVAQVFRAWLHSLRARLANRSRPGRVPVILQMTPIECGAACLAMILGYHGRKTRLAECREACGVGRDGLTARSIAAAARSFGLRVRAVSVEPAQFRHVQLPAIVHWQFNHFVVVERWSPGRVELVDPAAGRRALTAEAFDAGLTGVVLMMEPGAQFERRARAGLSWLSLLGRLLQMPGTVAQMVIASLMLQGFGLALPALTKILIDNHHALPIYMSQVLPVVGLGILLVVAAQSLVAYLRSLLLIYLQARLDTQLTLGFLEHLLALPFRFFQQRGSGDLVLRLTSNTIIREVLTVQMIGGVLDAALVLTYLVILLTQDVFFGLLTLGLGLLQLMMFTTTPRVRDLMQRELAAQSDHQSYLVEALTGILTLKAAGAEARALDRAAHLFFNQLNLALRRNYTSALIDLGIGALRILSPLLLLFIGTIRVMEGTLSLGTMLALNALAATFLMPLSALVSSGYRIQMVGTYLDRLVDVWEAEPEQDRQTARPRPALSGRIELRQVGFRYDANAPHVLRDISLTIEPGQKVALVGRTGSGKSTLARLLLGLYPPTEGEIVYDGHPLHELDYPALRSQFGVVLQEIHLFNGSIRQNIAFNRPDLSLEDVRQAAALAGIHEEIARMPMGYETLIAEGGQALSGGQRQRLAIARALAQSPVILLLDEATSHLDVVTERLVDENLGRRACTRIVIAHRLSTIRSADLILVLHEGGIVESGTHTALLAQGGHYAALVQSQLSGETDGGGAPVLAGSPTSYAGTPV